MASLWAQYKKEREGKEVLENEDGFAVYVINGDTCYIEDIFVHLYKRQEGVATKLADEISRIAKEKGCTKLLGSVHPGANGATASLRVLLAYGMKLHCVDGAMIYFIKQL